MSDFTANLSLILLQLKPHKMERIAEDIGIERSVLSKLKNGSRNPSAVHLRLIANHPAIHDPNQLLLPHEEFKGVLEKGQPSLHSPIHGLRVVAANLSACKKVEDTYVGQYVLYTPSKRDGLCVASLLEVGPTTSNGLSINIVNPYTGHDGKYLAFEYRGFMVPIAEYLYIFAEQKSADYEVLSIILHAAPVKPANTLEGIQNGVGVIQNRKYIAAVNAIAARVRTPIDNWRAALDTRLGYLKIPSLPELIQKKMIAQTLLILQ